MSSKIICVIFIFLCGCTQQEKTGTYTNMEYHAESGDVSGVELFLVFSNAGYYVLFQAAEGGPLPPVLTNAKIDGDKIEFTIPSGQQYSGKFAGTFNAYGIEGKFDESYLSDNGTSIFKLKHKKSYWQ